MNKPDTHFFGQDAHLTVSHQLHLEALTHGLARVYSLSPCFRAEMSQTARHLSEFYMLEAELAFVDRLDTLMAFVEACVKHVISSCKESDDFDTLWRLNGSEAGPSFGSSTEPWLRMSYDEPLQELASAKDAFEHSTEWGKIFKVNTNSISLRRSPTTHQSSSLTFHGW